jgi:tetratricopeptide (TPR) repeat protein
MNALFLEHWMYFPSIGLLLGIVETMAQTLKGQQRKLAAASLMAMAFALILGAKTYRQNEVWRNPFSFYNNIFDCGGGSARAHNNLALYYYDHEQFDNAIEEFNKAIKYSDAYSETHYNLAQAYLKLPNYKEHIGDAILQLKHSLEIDPNFYRSYQFLGDIYQSLLNDEKTAAAYHARATELNPQKQ